MSWKVTMSCESHSPAGKRMRWSRKLKNHPNLKAYLAEQLPSKFHGCEVRVRTPLHSFGAVVDPDTRAVTLLD